MRFVVFYFRFNNQLLLGMCLMLQAICTALIPAFRSIATMCFMFTGQGVAIGVVGIGKQLFTGKHLGIDLLTYFLWTWDLD